MVAINTAWVVMWNLQRDQPEDLPAVQEDGASDDMSAAEREAMDDVLTSVADLANMCLITPLTVIIRRQYPDDTKLHEWVDRYLGALDKDAIYIHYFTHRPAAMLPKIKEADVEKFVALTRSHTVSLRPKFQ
jgi:hypothetical protein